MNNQNGTVGGSLGEIVQRLMRGRDLHPAEIAASAGVSVKTVDACRGATTDGNLPGRLGLCAVVRALHLRRPIADADLAGLEAATKIPASLLVGGEAGSQRLERAIGARDESPVYADLRVREAGRLLRQLRIDRGLTESDVAGVSLVLSEAVVEAIEGGAVANTEWLRDVQVPAVLRSLHRVRPVDPADAATLDGLLGQCCGRCSAFLSKTAQPAWRVGVESDGPATEGGAV